MKTDYIILDARNALLAYKRDKLYGRRDAFSL